MCIRNRRCVESLSLKLIHQVESWICCKIYPVQQRSTLFRVLWMIQINLMLFSIFQIFQSILKRKTVTHIHSKKLATDSRKQCLRPKPQVSIHRYYMAYIFPNFWRKKLTCRMIHCQYPLNVDTHIVCFNCHKMLFFL